MMTAFQKRKLTYLFTLLDLNKNGSLQMDDFSEIAEKVAEKLDLERGDFPHKRVVDKAVKFFHKLLKDIPHHTNQSIKIDDWLTFFEEQILIDGDEDVLVEYIDLIIGFLFGMFDDNHDGYISKAEYKDIFTIYGMDADYWEKAFSYVDVNGDEYLSRYELKHAVETFLRSDDTTQKGNWIFGNWENMPSGV